MPGLEAGESITLAEVDAEIRFTDAGPRARRRAPSAPPPAALTRPRSPAQSAYLDLMRDHPLVFGIGPAGTGKTYLAAAFGAHMLYERRVERLILSRPALEAGERLGFLPGDLKEKIDPYLRPLYDALFDVLGEQAARLIEQGVIEVAPLAFMRGRTLTRAFVILDEAQNTTAAQMKMVLTRLGEDSQHGGDRRSVAKRPAGRPAGRPGRGACHPGRRGRRWRCSAFPMPMWCAMPSSAASSAPILRKGNDERRAITLLVEDPGWRKTRGLTARAAARGRRRRWRAQASRAKAASRCC